MDQKSGKGWQKWQKACSNVGVLSCKLKTLVKIKFISKIIIFQETLEFKHVVAFYYGVSRLYAKFASLGNYPNSF
jgi:hypothetical protein